MTKNTLQHVIFVMEETIQLKKIKAAVQTKKPLPYVRV